MAQREPPGQLVISRVHLGPTAFGGESVRPVCRETRLALPAGGQAQASIADAPRAHGRFAPPSVTLPQLLGVFFCLDCTSIGGRSASYLLSELVQRRGWLRRDDWLEGHLLGRVLPGPSGVGSGMFLAHMLGGPIAAALAMTLYVVPGLLIGIVLSSLIYGFDRPLWVDSAIHGLSASALGLFLYQSLRNASTSAKVRFGPVAAVAAFVAHGLLELDLVLVMASLGLVLVLLNRPAAHHEEQAR